MNPVSILYKSKASRYRPIRVADGPITARYRFIKNASWLNAGESVFTAKFLTGSICLYSVFKLLATDEQNITVPLCRTEISHKSCIPSSISAWNSLDIELRNSPSLASFKYQLKKLQNNSSVPTYYRTGSRYLSVLHARIRNNCSNLLSDLYINHLSPSPTCSCSEEVEDADHYFFNCPNYNNERDALLRANRDFYPLNIYTLLFGNENLTAEENTIIFTAVHTFIKDTRRFTN